MGSLERQKAFRQQLLYSSQREKKYGPPPLTPVKAGWGAWTSTSPGCNNMPQTQLHGGVREASGKLGLSFPPGNNKSPKLSPWRPHGDPGLHSHPAVISSTHVLGANGSRVETWNSTSSWREGGSTHTSARAPCPDSAAGCHSQFVLLGSNFAMGAVTNGETW